MANSTITGDLLGLFLEFTGLQSPLNQSLIAPTTGFNCEGQWSTRQVSMDSHPSAQLDASALQEQTNPPLLSVPESDINPCLLDGTRRFVSSPLAPNVRKHHSREDAILGNNRYGRSGKPRCDKCRQRKTKVMASKFLVGLTLVCL